MDFTAELEILFHASNFFSLNFLEPHSPIALRHELWINQLECLS